MQSFGYSHKDQESQPIGYACPQVNCVIRLATFLQALRLKRCDSAECDCLIYDTVVTQFKKGSL